MTSILAKKNRSKSSKSAQSISASHSLAIIEPPTYQCPFCRGTVFDDMGQSFTCQDCRANYSARFPEGRRQPDFRIDGGVHSKAPGSLDSSDLTASFQNRIKMVLRKYPAVYRFLVYVIGPALLLGPTSQTFVNSLSPYDQVLNIGSGVMRLKGNVTHLDYEPYPHLEVVGDAHHLPFTDNAFDAVICETLLEHVPEPARVINEMRRVLKPGGKIYVMMPFMFNFHAAPNDFYRFTHRGLEHRMQGFQKEMLKVIAGPTSALTCVLIEWLSMVFSLGNATLYRLLTLVFMVLLAPLKLFDFVLSAHPEAVRIASVLLYIGVKK